MSSHGPRPRGVGGRGQFPDVGDADFEDERAPLIYPLWHQRKTASERLSAADLSLIGPYLTRSAPPSDVRPGSGHRRRYSVCRGGERGIPRTYLTSVAKRRAGEVERERLRVRAGANIVPVEDVLPQCCIPAAG